MRFLALVTICVCGLWQFIDAQVALNGTCPLVPVIPNFNTSAYMGLWYEVAKYPAVFETGGKCIKANYELLENGSVAVVNSQYNAKTQQTTQIEGNAVVVENAKLMVQFPGQPTPTGSNYWILDTDYKSFSVVFSCKDTSPDSHAEIIWILTRDRVPSMDTSIKALLALTTNNLSLNYVTVTDQDGCE